MHGSDTAAYYALRSEYRDWAEEHLFPMSDSNWEEGVFNHQAWGLLTGEGFWEKFLPQDNSDWWPFCAALEGLSETGADSGFVISMVSQAGLFSGLLEFGSEQQRKRFVPRIMDGSLVAIAIAESHTGTHIGSLKSSVEEGRLKGEKFNISHAHTAELLLVLGRMPDEGKKDITAFLIEKGVSGLYREEGHEKVGNRTLPTGNLRFENLALEGENFLGAAGAGLKVISHIGTMQRAMYALIASGYLRPLQKLATQFLDGRPGSDSVLVKEKLNRAEMAMNEMRDAAMQALHAIFQREEDASLLASKAKLETTLKLQSTATDLISLLGSRGHFKGLANRLKLDAQGFLWIGGTEEAHRLNIARQT